MIPVRCPRTSRCPVSRGSVKLALAFFSIKTDGAVIWQAQIRLVER
jgi:hypothetical protein